MKKIGMQAIDEAIKNGVDLDGTPIPPKMLELYNKIMNEENKRERSGVKKSMRNRCVKTGSKHFDKDTLDQFQKLTECEWHVFRILKKQLDFRNKVTFVDFKKSKKLNK